MTRKCVPDEQYGQLWRRLEEVARRVDEGTVPFQPTMDGLQFLIQPSCEIVCVNVSSTIPFDRDMTKEGWTIESDAEVQDGEVTLELVGFLKKEENHAFGDEMVRRAKEKDVLFGQRHAEALLRNRDKIPEEWRKYILLFPGTVWRASDDSLHVPYLLWNGCRWCLGFRWLTNVFDFLSRLVCSRK